MAEATTVTDFAGLRVFTHNGHVGPLAVLGKQGPPAGFLGGVAFDAVIACAGVLAFFYAEASEIGCMHRLLLVEVFLGCARVF